MIDRSTFDRLDEAIDEFEASWSCDAKASSIESLLERHGLASDQSAIAELIRIDIELRYESGQPLELTQYLDRFEILHDRPDCIAGIAFEDYRARSALGYAISHARWKDLPGVRRESWYQDLAKASRRRQTQERIAELRSDPSEDAGFQVELAAVGFQLVQPIGSGAFSHVFLANQLELADRFVVLKIVNETLAEPERMATLQHTNIVPIYSSHRVLSRTVICMPYAGSVTLADFLNGRPGVAERSGESLIGTVEARIEDTKVMVNDASTHEAKLDAPSRIPAADDHAVLRPLERFKRLDCDALAVSIFSRLAAALSHAHVRGLLHNDLKPSNVLIRNDGEPALLDFNLAQSMGQPSPRRVGGTLPYMSPEMLRALLGAPEQTEPTSDLYSLGVMLFEFTTGRLPYPAAKSIAEIDLAPALAARQESPAWSPDDSVSPGLRAIINHCLQFEPEHRYQTADQLQADLLREQDHRSIIHADEPLRWKLKKWNRRHPRFVSASVVATLLLALLIPIATGLLHSTREVQRLDAQQRWTNFSQGSSDYLAAMMADPGRHEPRQVDRGFQLIEEFGVSDVDQAARMLDALSEDRASQAEEGLFIHVVHLGILEHARLWEQKETKSLDGDSVRRFKRLVELASFLDKEQDSKARMHLQAQFARLQGDAERHVALESDADSASMESDVETYLEAVRLLSVGDYRTSSELLESLADRGTVPSALRWTMLGRSQFQEDRFDQAKLSFTQSIERAPLSPALRVLRGRCHQKLGQRFAAEQDFRRATELSPKRAAPWYYLGYIQRSKGEYKASLQSFQKAAELAPDRIHLALQVGRAFQLLEQDADAERWMQKAFTMKCADSENYYHRALARLKRKQYDLATEDLSAATRLSPDSAHLLLELAWAQATHLHRYDEAIENYKMILEVRPYDENTLISLALAYLRQGKISLALGYTQEAMEEPNSPRTIYQAACVHAVVGRSSNRLRATTLLAESIRNGYHANAIDTDEDLDSIRDTDEFRAIKKFLDTSNQRKRRL
ncbi:protein kinase [Roseiconus lacunae]|uniref:protein kinase domain-containing protein n=1 Tax=Roseiconus lacunae TaxID=2605694 RepID=UPI003087B5B4|nr:protein kinase [Stieleria sp. HD01]